MSLAPRSNMPGRTSISGDDESRRPPTGLDDVDVEADPDELTDRDLGLEDEDPADRRRDPLRKP